MTPRKTILVVGSLNMDFIVQVSKLPLPGETISGRGFQMLPGGKGANQAYAAGRLGGQTKIIGRVGDDLFGERLRFSLESVGVDTVHLMSTANQPTGVAMIVVETGGQNQIVVIAGANASLSPSDLEIASASFQEGFLMLQLESPIETLEAAAALGKKRGMTTILDPAPARSLSSSLLRHVDVLTPNESEALHLLGRSARSIPLGEANEVAQRLLELGPRRTILKLGKNGVWLADDRWHGHFPTPKARAVDATGAGDTFNGALAVALAEGRSMEEAIRFANTAAAISVTRLGAQSSIPSRVEVDSVMAEQVLPASLEQ